MPLGLADGVGDNPHKHWLVTAVTGFCTKKQEAGSLMADLKLRIEKLVGHTWLVGGRCGHSARG